MQDTNEGPLSIHNTVLLSLNIKSLSMYLTTTPTTQIPFTGTLRSQGTTDSF